MNSLTENSLAEDLVELLGPNRVSTNPSVLEQHSHGESYDRAVLPEVVVFPVSTDDVAAVMRYATGRRIAVTPVGANSSLEGHTVPIRGGISLDLSQMNRILEFRPEDLLIVVQPGITYPEINDRVRHSGLFFPVDPGAHASIGGMTSTNASGTAAVRYGVTGDYVLALEVVLPSGEVIRTGSRARKSSSGYDLKRLFCGAEGTLGVITEITLRLTGLPEAVTAARVPFQSLLESAEYVTSLIQAGIPVARCELVDPGTIRAVNSHKGTAYPEQMTVFLEFHGNPQGLSAHMELAEDLAHGSGALAFEAGDDPAELAKLWDARHSAHYAYVAANPGLHGLVTDVAVPISALAAVVTRALEACEALGLNAYLIGHVGDGNFHLSIYHDDDVDVSGAAERIAHDLVGHALEVGGTATGEHGVGLRKLPYMRAEHGPALDVMRSLKQMFDPLGIMNPGKKLPEADLDRGGESGSNPNAR